MCALSYSLPVPRDVPVVPDRQADRERKAARNSELDPEDRSKRTHGADI